MSEELFVPATPGPLGPGDPDPRSPAAVLADAPRPLGPGEDDPRSPAQGTPITLAPPRGPGGSDVEEDSDLVMLAPAPPGPGDIGGGPRHVTHVPRQKPTVVPTSAAVEDQPAEAPATPAHEEIT